MRGRDARRSRGGSGKSAGFSLVELLVALVILLIGLALAAEIGVRARALLARSVRDGLRPPIAATLDLLRTDVQGADGYLPPRLGDTSGWTEEPLSLRTAGGEVLYRMVFGTFERATFDATGVQTAHLSLVRDAAAWRWRQVDSKLLEVSIAYLAEPGAPGAAGRAVRRDTLRLALRGTPQGWGW